MKVQVLFFAKSREVTGCAQCSLELQDGASTLDLQQKLFSAWPALQGVMQTCVLALNQEYIQLGDAHALSDNDEVAVIPPLSGG
jgi:molybdopterin converting factor subunit 1